MEKKKYYAITTVMTFEKTVLVPVEEVENIDEAIILVEKAVSDCSISLLDGEGDCETKQSPYANDDGMYELPETTTELYQVIHGTSAYRYIALSDGTRMGDNMYIFRTNAPVEELKALEKVSCEAYINDTEYPVWEEVLNDKGYSFSYIAEHRHVTPLGTSDMWLKTEYPSITEQYVIENQPEI